MTESDVTEAANGLTLERRDAIAGVVMIAIALGVGFVAWRFYDLSVNSQPGPGFFAFVVAGILLVLGVVLAVTSLAVPRDRQRPIDTDHRLFRRPKVLAFYFGVVLAAVVVLEPLGFMLTCAALMSVLCKAIGGDRVSVMGAVIYGVSLSVVTYFLFAYVLGIALPEGIIPL